MGGAVSLRSVLFRVRADFAVGIRLVIVLDLFSDDRAISALNSNYIPKIYETYSLVHSFKSRSVTFAHRDRGRALHRSGNRFLGGNEYRNGAGRRNPNLYCPL